MIRFLKYILCAFIIGGVAASCGSDDDAGDMYLYVSYGNVQLTSDGSFVLNDDGGSILHVLNSGPGLDAVRDGDRAVYKFRMDGRLADVVVGEETFPAYDVALYQIYPVLAKKAVVAEEEPSDGDDEFTDGELGDDQINIRRVWFGGDYINVMFYVLHRADATSAHFISLERETQAQVMANAPQRETIVLRLRHNAYEDSPKKAEGDYYYAKGRVSFDIASLVPEGMTEVDIVLRWTDYGSMIEGVEKELHTTYRLSDGVRSIAGSVVEAMEEMEISLK